VAQPGPGVVEGFVSLRQALGAPVLTMACLRRWSAGSGALVQPSRGRDVSGAKTMRRMRAGEDSTLEGGIHPSWVGLSGEHVPLRGFGRNG